MDQFLSQLIPTQRIGNDGFNWWVGQVEGTASAEVNNKGGYRYKVRIVGDHPGSKEIIDTKELPWATVMMPVNVPFMPGNVGGGRPQLAVGCWVIGFYIDAERQKPIIMGSIGQVPGATKVVIDERPDLPPFTTFIPNTVNPAVDGLPTGADGENTGTGGMSDGTTKTTKDGTKKPRVAVPPKKTAPLKKGSPLSEEWCQQRAEKCSKKDLTESMTVIMSEFLAEVQNNNGNIGTYLVNEATGGLMDGIGVARKYVNKSMRVVNEFVANIKGFIIEKMTNGVKDLINSLLYPSEEGNALTPVTEWFNNLLKNLGCSMADLGDRLAKWLTNLLMSYVNQIYRAVACQIDELVNGIVSKIQQLMNELFDKILGPLQTILGAIAAPLNIIGGAINQVLNLLGISCSGPNTECSKYKQVCTEGDKKEPEGKDFLDGLLDSIDNLFPATGPDYTNYVCPEAFTGKPLETTSVGFTGGVPLPGGDPNAGGPGGVNPKKPKIVYSISDITVTEGQDANLVVTRTGSTEFASSVKYKTLKNLGTATPGEDYLESSDILGFAPGETQKGFSIKTLYSEGNEPQETFFVQITKNTPQSGSDLSTKFEKNLATVTIVEYNPQEPGTSYPVKPTNPFEEIDNTFPPDETDIPTPSPVEDPYGGGIPIPTYSVTANRTTCPEGEFIVYTINTTDVENDTKLYYTLIGTDIDSDDIVGGELSGEIIIFNNTAKVTIGIEEDGVIEDDEILTFSINGTGAFTNVTLTSAKESTDPGDYDESEEGDELVTEPFVPPTVNEEDIITDEDGGIIEIPVDDPGDPWAEPPFVFIGGEGVGATATALLDENGFLTEIRVKSPGYGYKKNLANDKGLRCIIDDFTLVRPGTGYKEIPDVYINGELGIAEAVINSDGFVIGARILDRTRTFDEFPKIDVVGGGGYGAKLLPSLVCLDTKDLTTRGATKIGTGKYIDCP